MHMCMCECVRQAGLEPVTSCLSLSGARLTGVSQDIQVHFLNNTFRKEKLWNFC